MNFNVDLTGVINRLRLQIADLTVELAVKNQLIEQLVANLETEEPEADA
jgi:hypothetical protein